MPTEDTCTAIQFVVSEADDLRHDVVVNVTEVTKGTKEDVECSANGICNREIGICACLDGFASGADDGEPLGAYGQRGDCGFRHTGTKNEKWENSEMQYLCANQIFNPTFMCAYSKGSTRALRLCFENSTRAIDSSKNQPNRLRFDRAREFQSLVGASQTNG